MIGSGNISPEQGSGLGHVAHEQSPPVPQATPEFRPQFGLVESPRRVPAGTGELLGYLLRRPSR